MKWHPVAHSLAIGWQDGCITLWHEDDRLTRDEKVRKLQKNSKQQNVLKFEFEPIFF